MVTVFHSLKNILKNRRSKIRIFLCIPLCDGVHFQGYVVDVCNKIIVHIDSIRNNSSKNATSKATEATLFDDANINFKFYFIWRIQFDSNICGVWLVAGIIPYVHALPLLLRLDDAFDIAYNSLERKAKIPINSSVPTSSNWIRVDHIGVSLTTHFLFHALTEDPFRSEFYIEDALENLSTKKCHQNKCMIKSIKNQVEFLSLHHKART